VLGAGTPVARQAAVILELRRVPVHFVLIAASLGSTVIGMCAIAASPSPAPTAVTLAPVADAYIRSGTTAATNFGADPLLLTKLSSTGTSTRETYLKFDLQNITTVGTARLRLHGSLDDTASANVAVAAFPVGDTSWTESAITWNSRPAGSVWPNEPGEFGAIADQPWNAAVGGGWNRRPDGTDRIVSDAAAPMSPTNVLEYIYSIGLVDGVAPATQYYPLSTKEVFVGLWWKPSNPWQGDISSVNKIQFLQVQNSSIYMAMYGPNGGPYELRCDAQWPEQGTAWLVPNVSSGRVTLGQWHRLEWYLKYESRYGARDGVIRWWLDGVLAGSYANVRYPNDSGFVEYQISPTWGGNTGDVKTQRDFFRFDHSYLSKPARGIGAIATARIADAVPAWYEWDVTAWLRAHVAAGHNTASLVLKNATATSSRVQFASREASSNRPQLVVSSAPPDAGASDVVMYAQDAAVVRGSWTFVADQTAAGGSRLRHPDAGAAKLAAALGNPTNFFDITFAADANTPYRLWIRGKADGDSYSNDSVYVQFSDSIDANATPVYRIGTASSSTYVLEDCSGCGDAGWGWQDNGYGAGVLGPLIYFATTGTHTIRVQTREDGLSIDQIVLSSGKYLSVAPGRTRNDATILPR
jgi:hypothetical protein